MLFTFAAWLFIAFLCVLYGLAGVRVLRWVFRLPDERAPDAASTALLGTAIITTLAELLSLGMRLSGEAFALVAIGGLAIAFLERNQIHTLFRTVPTQSWPVLALGGLVLAGVLIKTSQLPLNYDTGLYHAQAIRWMETYPAVPGLGNLGYRLAFNSAWLAFSALFSFSFLGLGSFHIVDGYIYLLFAFFCLTRLAPLLRGRLSIAGLAAALLLILSRVFLGQEWSSPGTDLPTAVCIWVILLFSLEKIERGGPYAFDLELGTITVLAIFVVVIKLSALPVLLLPLISLILARKSIGRTRLLVLGCLGLFLTLPWAARNVILSGYLIFPFPKLDLFHPDWKIPALYAADARNGITSWARLPSRDQTEVLATLAMPLKAWVAPWFQALTRSIKLLLSATVLSAVVWAASLLFPSFRKRFNSADGTLIQAAPAFVALVGVLFWFFQAPDPRFGYGFLIGFVGTALLPLLAWLLGPARQRTIGMAALIVAILFLVQLSSLANSFRNHEPGQALIFPATYPQVKVVSQQLGNFSTWMPADGTDQCWYAPLPCTPTDNPQVRLRGNSLRDGFWTKLPD